MSSYVAAGLKIKGKKLLDCGRQIGSEQTDADGQLDGDKKAGRSGRF